ncbi:hypothetical protein AB0O04_34925 [Streptomyces althioticus]|uniref:hypothetical protein n=1 Tax=Streptomyces althioticus TaxID=83380 RepID=UPI003423F0E2
MNEYPPDVHLVVYEPGRFPAHEPFAERGYLFTVPGSYPDDTPPHTNVTDWEMAVYQTGDGDDWEVRDTHGDRHVWATASSRREAIGLAFLEIARQRRTQAADIAKKRDAAGLAPVPPYALEITSSVTLVTAPTAIAILARIEPARDDTPARYHVLDVDGGAPYVIRQDDGVTLRTVTVGVLHHDCDHDLTGVTSTHETEADAHVTAQSRLHAYWPCTQLPD